MMPTDGDQPDIVVVSNRGPIAFRTDDRGEVVPTRSGGGLAVSLAPALAGTNATWIAAAVRDAQSQDLSDVSMDLGGIRLRELAVPSATYRQYYDVIANGTLWFLHHHLFDLARRPRIDHRWWDAWNTYCHVNDEFARVVADTAPDGAVVLIHDYHLTLLGDTLRERRPDVRTVHFHHIPFAGPDSITLLPPVALQRLFQGLAGHDACGFHSERWANNFVESCESVLGMAPRVFASAATPDIQELERVRSSDDVRRADEQLEQLVGDKKLIVRVDRMELSKNLLRGFYAFDDLLRRHSTWRERVIFAAHLYPSRENLAEYRAYRNEVEGLVDQINAEWSTPQWQPIILNVRDDFARSVAAFKRYDVLLVNPIRDGLNLVAKEGALLNECNGSIVLSREASAWRELEHCAIGINPFDVVDTSDALLRSLEMPDTERATRAGQLRVASSQRQPQDWLNDQIRSVIP